MSNFQKLFVGIGKKKQKLSRMKTCKNCQKAMSFQLQANPPLNNKYPIINNISLSYNLVEHYFSPILQKEAIEIVEKGFTMLKMNRVQKTCELSSLYLFPNFHKLLILLLKGLLKNKIIIQHPSAKTKEVIWQYIQGF